MNLYVPVKELLRMDKLREPLQITTNAANADNLGLSLEKLGSKFVELSLIHI